MSGAGKILVVEDDPIIQRFIRDCLRLAGKRADFVADGLAADRKLQAESYDLVLSDLRLPGLDGLSLLARYGRRETTRFLMISGVATVEQAVEAMKLGAFDFLAKPFRPGVLQARIREALARPARG